jgi:hypothetical protein
MTDDVSPTNNILNCMEIDLQHSIMTNIVPNEHKTVLHETTNVLPPEEILCGKLESIRLECDFANMEWAQNHWVKTASPTHFNGLYDQNSLSTDPYQTLRSPLHGFQFRKIQVDSGSQSKTALPIADSPTPKQKRKAEHSSIRKSSVRALTANRQKSIREVVKNDRGRVFSTKSEYGSMLEQVAYTSSTLSTSIFDVTNRYRNCQH